MREALRNIFMQSKYVCCTWNNPTEELQPYFDRLFETGKVSYIVGQPEVGEECGTYHFQFYVESPKRLRLRQWKRLLGDPVSLRQRRASAEVAAEYCKKPETKAGEHYELGTISKSKQGNRTDLQLAQQMLDEGCTMRDLSREIFPTFVKYERGLYSYMAHNAEPRRWEMEVYVLWGATGLGKTRKVYDDADGREEEVYPLAQNYNGGVVWWDGYHGQKNILIDDFYGWLPWSYLLRLLDRYPMLVRNHGGHMQFSSTRIYITSNQDPREWYKYNEGSMKWETLARRLTKIEHFVSINSAS